MTAGHEKKLGPWTIKKIKEEVNTYCKCCGSRITQAALAKKYGVSQTLISFAIRDKKHFAKKRGRIRGIDSCFAIVHIPVCNNERGNDEGQDAAGT